MTPLQALVAFAHRRPRLDFANYRRPRLDFANYGDNRTAYRADARTIQGHLRRFEAALETAQALGITSDDLLKAAPRAFSGRLEFKTHAFHQPHDNWFRAHLCADCGKPKDEHPACSIDYTPGQYFPTEYRLAAASVLETAIATHRQANPPQDQDVPSTVQEAKDRNKAAGLNYFAKDTMRFFRGRLHGMPFPGCIIESTQFAPSHGPAHARTYRPVFVRANGQTWRPYPGKEFPTAARARKEAHRMREHNEIQWKD